MIEYICQIELIRDTAFDIQAVLAFINYGKSFGDYYGILFKSQIFKFSLLFGRMESFDSALEFFIQFLKFKQQNSPEKLDKKLFSFVEIYNTPIRWKLSEKKIQFNEI